MKKSIARRTTFVLTCLVSLAVCLSAMLAYFSYVYIQDKMIDNLIQTESRRLVTRVSRFGDEWTTAFERDMAPSMYAWGESPKNPSDSLPAELRGLPAGLHSIDKGDRTWHVAIENAMDGRLYVLYDTIVIEGQLREFAWTLVAIVIVCSILALFISNSVAQWLINPLNVLTERLTRWIPSASTAMTVHSNEADRLMEVFNRVQDQVDASIADQREFSANLHHEIRTPLTVIRSDAELMLKGNIKDPDGVRSRLERIVKSVQEINQSLESTYSLAYARFEDEGRVKVRASVEDIFENLRLEAGKAGLAFVNLVESAHEETLSCHALMTVMRNIIRNAVLHAAPGTLVVESISGGLQFTDSGPGIEPAELASVFDRYFSNRRADQRQNAHGESTSSSNINQTGLGLAIAKRVCIMQSWSLDVTSPVSAGSGTRFTLVFN